MGLIITFIIVGAILIGIGCWMKFHEQCYYDGEEWAFVFGTLILIAAFIMSAVAMHSYSYKDVATENYRIKYDILTRQLNENYYDTEYYDGRKGLIDDVLEYNEDVLYGRAKHNSIWIGCFYPEDWESLPLIELKGEKKAHE
jgi:glucan phosphoethanolaminetransferase (alkaline phosphatase superfamily)